MKKLALLLMGCFWTMSLLGAMGCPATTSAGRPNADKAKPME